MARNPQREADYRPWGEEELQEAKRLRAAVPPVPFAVIARQYKRSEGAVRAKLHHDQHAASYGGSRPVGFPRSERAFAPPAVENPDRDLCDRVMADGGFSAFSTYHIRGPIHGLCRPLLGPGSIPRPPGWRDAMTPETAEQQAHLSAIRAQWMVERETIKPRDDAACPDQ